MAALSRFGRRWSSAFVVHAALLVFLGLTSALARSGTTTTTSLPQWTAYGVNASSPAYWHTSTSTVPPGTRTASVPSFQHTTAGLGRGIRYGGSNTTTTTAFPSDTRLGRGIRYGSSNTTTTTAYPSRSKRYNRTNRNWDSSSDLSGFDDMSFVLGALPTHGVTRTTTLFPPPARKYPTTVASLREPRKAEVDRCTIRITVPELTDGARSSLLSATVSAGVNPSVNRLFIKIRSADQRPPPSSFVSRFFRTLRDAFLGTDERYQYFASIPDGCVFYQYDHDAMLYEESSGAYLTAVTVRLTPEVFATYETSSASFPDVPRTDYFGTNHLRHLDHCLFAMKVLDPIEPGSLELSASVHHLQVTGRRPGVFGPKVLSKVRLPCQCQPTRLGLVSWWVDEAHTRYPSIVGYVGMDYNASRDDNCHQQLLRNVGRNELLAHITYLDKPFASISR